MADAERNTHSVFPQHPLASLPFPEAAVRWLESRRGRISPKTFHEYELNIKTLSAFFGEMALREIDGEQIRAYQRMRMAQCGPFAINHECSVLQQMLKRIGRWPDIAWDYEPLPLPKQKRGRALLAEERERLLRAAQTDSNWEAACLFATISMNTTAGPAETATLRLKDVDLPRRLLTVQPDGAKNPHRVRPIPLNDEAYDAARRAIDRARRLGACAPHHFVFPFRVHRAKFDPTRHQTTFKTAWRKLTAAADLPGLRMYDLRHHAITVLLENPEVSEETAETIAGHISRNMKKRYSHVRMDAMRAALGKMGESRYSAARLGNSDVLDLLASGFSVDLIVAKIKASPCAFETSIGELKQLKASGIPDGVIRAMVEAG